MNLTHLVLCAFAASAAAQQYAEYTRDQPSYQQPVYPQEYPQPCANYESPYVTEGEYDATDGGGYRMLTEDDPACNPLYWKKYLVYVKVCFILLLALLVASCCFCCCTWSSIAAGTVDDAANSTPSSTSQEFPGGVISKAQQENAIRNDMQSGRIVSRTKPDNVIDTRAFVANYFTR